MHMSYMVPNIRKNDAQSLREKLRKLECEVMAGGEVSVLSTSFDVIDQALIENGISFRHVHEFNGAQAHGFILQLLKQEQSGQHHYCLWCRMSSAVDYPYGPAFTVQSLNLEHIYFVECQNNKDLLWAMEEGLRSGAVSVVVGEVSRSISLTASRRLQLAAESGSSLGLVATNNDQKMPHNAFYSRWRVNPSPTRLSEKYAWDVELLRMRGAKPGRWRVSETGFHD